MNIFQFRGKFPGLMNKLMTPLVSWVVMAKACSRNGSDYYLIFGVGMERITYLNNMQVFSNQSVSVPTTSQERMISKDGTACPPTPLSLPRRYYSAGRNRLPWERPSRQNTLLVNNQVRGTWRMTFHVISSYQIRVHSSGTRCPPTQP